MVCDAGFYGFNEIIRQRKSKDGYKIILATIGSSMICVCILDEDNFIFGQKCFCSSRTPKVKKHVQLDALHYYNQLKDAMMKRHLEDYR